jgi:hypothetical protein
MKIMVIGILISKKIILIHFLSKCLKRYGNKNLIS